MKTFGRLLSYAATGAFLVFWLDILAGRLWPGVAIVIDSALIGFAVAIGIQLAFALVALRGLILARSTLSAHWRRVVFVTAATGGVLTWGVLVGACAAFGVGHNDPADEVFFRAETSDGEVVATRSSAGAFSSYRTDVYQTCEFLPGLLLLHPLASDRAAVATVEIEQRRIVIAFPQRSTPSAPLPDRQVEARLMRLPCRR